MVNELCLRQHVHHRPAMQPRSMVETRSILQHKLAVPARECHLGMPRSERLSRRWLCRGRPSLQAKAHAIAQRMPYGSWGGRNETRHAWRVMQRRCAVVWRCTVARCDRSMWLRIRLRQPGRREPLPPLNGIITTHPAIDRDRVRRPPMSRWERCVCGCRHAMANIELCLEAAGPLISLSDKCVERKTSVFDVHFRVIAYCWCWFCSRRTCAHTHPVDRPVRATVSRESE